MPPESLASGEQTTEETKSPQPSADIGLSGSEISSINKDPPIIQQTQSNKGTDSVKHSDY